MAHIVRSKEVLRALLGCFSFAISAVISLLLEISSIKHMNFSSGLFFFFEIDKVS